MAFLAGGIIWVDEATAAPINAWNYAFTFNSGVPVGTNVYRIDSAVAYGIVGSADSVRFGKCAIFTPPGHAAMDDTLNPYRNTAVSNNATTFPSLNAPAIFVIYYTSLLPDTIAKFEFPGIGIGMGTHVLQTDSLNETVTASLDWVAGADTIWGVDSTTIDSSRLGAWLIANIGVGIGTGAYHDTIRVVDTSGTDDTLTNVRVHVDDLSRTRKATVNTGSTGILGVAKLDNEGLTFAVQATNYFQDGGIDTITMPASDTFVTIQVYDFAANVPGNSDSCTLVFYMPSVEYRAIITPQLSGPGARTTTGFLIDPKPATADPNASTLIAQKSVLRSNESSDSSLTYTITVKRKYDGEVLFEIPDYVVPDSTSHVVTW